MRFFWDMDGVLYDFDKLFKEVMPGVDMEDDESWSWEELHAICPGMYLQGDLMPGILPVWDMTNNLGANYILTAIPRRWNWPHATAHKRSWAIKNLGVTADQVLFGPHAVDKQFHCTGPQDVLIDDRIRNITQWIARGGTGIHHTSPETTARAIQDIFTKFFTE